MLFLGSMHAQYSVGDKATDFNLMGTDDKMHSLAGIEGAKGYAIVFTCNHCPYSVLYEDRLIALQREYGPKGVHVVAINPNNPEKYPDDSFEKMKVRAAEKEFNFLYLFDDGQKVYPQYGATKTPHVYLVDSDMTVRYIGAIDDDAKNPAAVEENYLGNAMMALANGKEISVKSTKAVGCTIK